jgi:hydroxyethylthiazole kinase-like uncharacterized protein yjeF
MIERLKVVTPHEMARIEKLAYDAGISEATFMEQAGKAIAAIVEAFIEMMELDEVVTLLIGKGNNGGDAYVAGRHLIKHGYQVIAYPLCPLEDCGPLCREMGKKFVQSGGKIQKQLFPFEPEGVIVDGLVGTGFHGKAEGELAQAIIAANDAHVPKIAIDIPSGLNGTTGEVATVAIRADLTIYLGLPKMGFFLKEGWNYVGELVYASFGLEEKYIAEAKPEAHYINHNKIKKYLPPLSRTRHKYEAGYVLGIGGSPSMPGAALLSSYAALRSGAGIVRLFHPEGMEQLLSNAPYELIREGWDQKNEDKILLEAQRAKAAFLGPGMGRDQKTKQAVKSLLAHLKIPCVLDADVLYFLSESPSWKLPPHIVLTPHHGEMQRLLGKTKEQSFELVDCQDYVEDKQVILVLKGAPTFIFHPGDRPSIIAAGDPGMATAGAGDVLTGMIAALIAQGMSCLDGAIVAVALHAISGELAAGDLTSYCMTASDIIDYLPEAFGEK